MPDNVPAVLISEIEQLGKETGSCRSHRSDGDEARVACKTIRAIWRPFRDPAQEIHSD
jgi:hypothetical protein